MTVRKNSVQLKRRDDLSSSSIDVSAAMLGGITLGFVKTRDRDTRCTALPISLSYESKDFHSQWSAVEYLKECHAQGADEIVHWEIRL